MMPIVRTLDLTTLTLGKGAHDSPEHGLCALEAAAFIAGREHSDHPPCVSPVIGEFVRSWNDGMNDDDRQMLVPYVTRILDTNTGAAHEEVRAWMCLDWLCRVQTPAWLRLAGLTSHAQALESIARICDAKTASAAQPALDAAWDAARDAAGAAAWDAARAAAWDAAGDAAGAAAGAAAWDAAGYAAGAAAGAAAWDAAGAAAWDAARDAAGDAAGAAARDAARDAAGKALRPTVEELQRSALGLLDRLIAVSTDALRVA